MGTILGYPYGEEAGPLIELHPEAGDEAWVEWDSDDIPDDQLPTCVFCGEKVYEGYYNARTEQYSCRVNDAYDAAIAYDSWLDDE